MSCTGFRSFSFDEEFSVFPLSAMIRLSMLRDNDFLDWCRNRRLLENFDCIRRIHLRQYTSKALHKHIVPMLTLVLSACTSVQSKIGSTLCCKVVFISFMHTVAPLYYFAGLYIIFTLHTYSIATTIINVVCNQRFGNFHGPLILEHQVQPS